MYEINEKQEYILMEQEKRFSTDTQIMRRICSKSIVIIQVGTEISVMATIVSGGKTEKQHGKTTEGTDSCNTLYCSCGSGHEYECECRNTETEGNCRLQKVYGTVQSIYNAKGKFILWRNKRKAYL